MYLCRNVSKAHYMRGGADVILLLYLTKNRVQYREKRFVVMYMHQKVCKFIDQNCLRTKNCLQ